MTFYSQNLLWLRFRNTIELITNVIIDCLTKSACCYFLFACCVSNMLTTKMYSFFTEKYDHIPLSHSSSQIEIWMHCDETINCVMNKLPD